MIKELIKVADYLDRLGLEKEANLVDGIIQKWAGLDDSGFLELNRGKQKNDHDIRFIIQKHKLGETTQEEAQILQEFEKIIAKIRKEYGWNLSYMKIQITNVCMFNDNTADYKRNPKECAGSWTKEKLIHIGDKNHLQSVMKYYGLNISSDKFIKSILAHELMHEVYRNILSDKEKAFYKKHISSLNFTTEYLDTVTNPDSYDEEAFCEYIATQLTQTPR